MENRNFGEYLNLTVESFRFSDGIVIILNIIITNPMCFTPGEIEIMQSIFKRLEKTTIQSLQFYNKDNDLRTGCTQIVYNKWKKPICIFQNFDNLSPFRMKLLMRLADKISYPLHITNPNKDIQTIGWKIK